MSGSILRVYSQLGRGCMGNSTGPGMGTERRAVPQMAGEKGGQKDPLSWCGSCLLPTRAICICC